MVLDREEIENLKEHVDCRELAQRLLGLPAKRVGKQAVQYECPFHQETDASFTVWKDGFKCFGCGESGDQIALIQKLEGYDFMEVIRYLSGRNGNPMRQVVPEWRSAVQHREKRPAWRSEEWQRSAKSIIELGRANLEGSIGAEYLLRRGIHPPTWEAFSLGFLPNVRRWENRNGEWQVAEDMGPAITIPWTDGQSIRAIQYRLIDHRQRYWQKAGSDRTLFGPEQLGGRDILVICEGELNAISIWQTSSSIVDAVSFGPEDNVQHAAAAMQELAKGYQYVVIWADKADRALEALAVVDSTAIPLQSPNGRDANDLLQTGQLGDFVVEFLRAHGIIVLGRDGLNESTPFEKAGQRYSTLEIELEDLLSRLGTSPGTVMEWKDPQHPAHDTWRRFCEVEAEWIARAKAVDQHESE